MAWDDEKRAKAIKMYQARNPTADNSPEIVAEIAEELEETPNGVRMILSRAKVYIKQDGGVSSSTPNTDAQTKEKVTGKTRVSKESSIEILKDTIRQYGIDPSDEILDKLTGKAAVYLTGVIGVVAEFVKQDQED